MCGGWRVYSLFDPLRRSVRNHLLWSSSDMPSSAFRAALVTLATVCLCQMVTAQSSSPADTLTGRVTDAATGTPIAGASVFVTRGPDRLVLRDTSDTDGRWRVIFAPGTGDYLVFIAAPGAESFRKRIARLAGEQRFVIDAILKSGGVAQLAAVRVQAQAPRPNRADRTGALPTIGSSERVAEGVFAAVSPTSLGNPLALAATIPGLNVGPGGISALGAGGDQSLVTLNGLASGASLPRQAGTRTRGSLSNFDPAVGGFSGALLNQELEPGREDTDRNASLTIDAPMLRANDALARAFGLRPTTFQASIGQTGQIVDDRLFYTAAAQLARRSAAQATLLNAPPDVLALEGLDPADVTRVRQSLDSARVPNTSAAANRLVEQFNAVAQLDRTPRGAHAMRFTALVDAQRTLAAGLSPISLPSNGSTEQSVTGALQFGSVAFIGKARPYQNDFRTSVSVQSTDVSARSGLPFSVIRVPDLVADPIDPAVTVPTLLVGGFAGPTGQRTTATWEIADDLSWLRAGRRHLFKAHAWSRIDALTDETVSDARGTFAFNTLNDFARRSPAVYTRTLAQPARSGVAWNSAAAFGHRWAPSRVFQLLWGARVEGNRFLGTPAANPSLESALSVRTDATPSALTISPRLGVTWYLIRDEAGSVSVTSGDLMRRSTISSGMIRAGIGEFRGLYRADVLASADGATGLTSGVRRLTCVGASVPRPDWSLYDSGETPTACAAGSAGLTDVAPPVSVLGSAYAPPRNWRATLGWTSQLPRLRYRVDAAYALNRRQAGLIDRNLRETPSFTLAGEDARAVFVSPASIDAATGAVSPASARIATQFGSVLERVSDMRGRAANVTVSLTPDLSGFGRGDTFLNLNYVWASARSTARGIDGGSGRDPRAVEWARSPFDIRHQVIAQLSHSLQIGVGLSLFISMQSGLPFTPTVAGDINGDGRANDRAFIPAGASPALDAVIANAPRNVASCLREQRGRIAGRNSCEGPWSQSVQFRLDVAGRAIGLPARTRFGFQFVNPLGALDRAFNGGDGLRGWGTASAPDPVLLVPRAFNPTSSTFTYDVNPRFGETRPSRISRPIEPFGVTLDVRFDFSVPGEVQELQRQMKPGRGGDTRPRLTSDTLMARYQRSMPSLYVALQSLSDTLLLTPTQLDSLALYEARYRSTLDSLYRPLVTYLAALPDSYDGKATLERVQAADSLAWDVTYLTGAQAKAILSPLQLTIVPQFLTSIMNESPESLRRSHARYEIAVSRQGTNFTMNRR
jgi:hypothetical protein